MQPELDAPIVTYIREEYIHKQVTCHCQFLSQWKLSIPLLRARIAANWWSLNSCILKVSLVHCLTKCVIYGQRRRNLNGKQLVPSVRWRSPGTLNLPWDVQRVKRRYGHVLDWNPWLAKTLFMLNTDNNVFLIVLNISFSFSIVHVQTIKQQKNKI